MPAFKLKKFALSDVDAGLCIRKTARRDATRGGS
jgi:hypothetical protein